MPPTKMASLVLCGLALILTAKTGHCDNTLDFVWKKNRIELRVIDHSVRAFLNGSSNFQRSSSIQTPDSIVIVDANFDSYPDVMVLRNLGIEKQYDVYLFDSRKGKYLLDDFLSKLSCISIDNSAKTVTAACAIATGCEHREDVYRYSKSKLILVRRISSTCNPVTGEFFRSVDEHPNRKRMRADAAKTSH